MPRFDNFGMADPPPPPPTHKYPTGIANLFPNIDVYCSRSQDICVAIILFFLRQR